MAFRLIIFILLLTFTGTSILPLPQAYAQTAIHLPSPRGLVPFSREFSPIQIRGIQLDPANPLRLDFLVDKGDQSINGQPLKDEIARLAKYFLTCLTVPEEDLWVNLSPYEQDRIAAPGFGVTQMGKDLLEQDYLLKQITASSSYPESALGRRFWQSVYKKAQELYGTTQIPTSTFNKIWIVPKYAQVYVRGNSAFVVKSTLDVMMETDYLALKKQLPHQQVSQYSKAYTQAFRDIILPQLRREINEGKNFALLRQVYDAMILATWYKRHLKNGLLGKSYVGQNKVNGVDVADKNVKEKIFQQYVQSFKKNVYNYIREEVDPLTQKIIPRKYVSGGLNLSFTKPGQYVENVLIRPVLGPDLAMGRIILSPSFNSARRMKDVNPAMLSKLKKAASGLVVGVMLSTAGMGFMGSAAKAATFSADADGKITIHIQGNEQSPGHIIEQMRIAFIKADKSPRKAVYNSSDFGGAMWGPQGAYQKVVGDQTFQIKKGEQIKINKPFPAEALALLPQAPRSAPAEVTPPSTKRSYVPSRPEIRGDSEVPAAKAPASPPPQASIMPVVGAVSSRSNNPGFDAGSALAQADQILGGSVKATPSLPAITSAGTVSSPGHSTDISRSLQEAGDLLKSGQNGPVVRSTPVAASSTYVSSGDQLFSQKNLLIIGGVLAVFLTFSGGRRIYRGYNFKKVQSREAAAAQQRLSTTIAGSTPPPPEDEERLFNGIPFQGLVDGPRPATVEEQVILKRNLERMQRGEFEIPVENKAPAARSFWRFGWGNAFNLLTSGLFVYISATMMGLGDYWQWLWLASAGMSMSGILNMPGVLFCGILSMTKLIPDEGIKTSELNGWRGWLRKATIVLADRGNQQMGRATAYTDRKGNIKPYIRKVTKIKRWISWPDGVWHWPVFYRNMITHSDRQYARGLPTVFKGIDNFGLPRTYDEDMHVRYATGGNLNIKAPHPHSSSVERKKIWIMDAARGLVSVDHDVFVVVAHNGDNDASKIGFPDYTTSIFGEELDVPQMRRYFSAVTHLYYKDKVTKKYLRSSVVSDKLTLDYGKILKALYKKGYLQADGKVSRRFKGVDAEFKSLFSGAGYEAEGIFNQIESALFGLPPGDSPIIPLQIRLYLTHDWDSAIRYAHVMVNHKTVAEAMDDILFEDEEKAAGAVFDQEFSKAHKMLMREGAVRDPSNPLTMKDLWVRDLQYAKERGLETQFKILDMFKQQLAARMAMEIQGDTPAGRVFKQWEKKWAQQGGQVHLKRDKFIRVAMEKFFTAGREGAVKEFAERSEGTHGIFVKTSVLNNGKTFYSNFQDVVVGINEKEGIFVGASAPNVLKTIGPNGEQMERTMSLEKGEVVDISFDGSGKLNIQSSKLSRGRWVRTAFDEIQRRLSPIAKLVEGKENPYYAQESWQPNNPRTAIREELEMVPALMQKSQDQWLNPDSFNRQTSANLARRLSQSQDINGKKRLVIVGYGNSKTIPESLRASLTNLVPKLHVDIYDSNDFSEDPENEKFGLTPDTVVLIISKSGATFASKVSLMLAKKLIRKSHLFVLTARVDSVLGNILGQGLNPGDPFKGQMYFTGDVFPSEAPLASELLLSHQLSQIVLNLVQDIQELPDQKAKFGVKLSSEDLVGMQSELFNSSFEMAQKMIGVDALGKKYQHADQTMPKLGEYLGKIARRPWDVNRKMDVITWGILMSKAPLAGLMYFLGGLPETFVGLGLMSIVDTMLIRYNIPWKLAEWHSRRNGRPANARTGAFKLFIATDDGLHQPIANFFSRLFANGLASTSPAAIYNEDSKSFVENLGEKVTRGDVILTFNITSRSSTIAMSSGQATFPTTGIYKNYYKGKGEVRSVVIDVPIINQISDEISALKNQDNGQGRNVIQGTFGHKTESRIKMLEVKKKFFQDTVGVFGISVASKVIGVKMFEVASLQGRLWKGDTFSNAVNHTTPTPIGVTAKAVSILERPDLKADDDEPNPLTRTGGDSAMVSRQAKSTKGGIDMNSRFMDLKINEEKASRLAAQNKAWLSTPILGVTPQVLSIQTVTPAMLQKLLGAPNLN